MQLEAMITGLLLNYLVETFPSLLIGSSVVSPPSSFISKSLEVDDFLNFYFSTP